MHCLGAKVNHQLVSINEELKSGDVVEIITGNNQTPSINWQKFVVTSKARNSVNKHLKITGINESIKLGREILFKTLRRLKIYRQKQEYLDAYSSFGFNNEDFLFISYWPWKDNFS